MKRARRLFGTLALASILAACGPLDGGETAAPRTQRQVRLVDGDVVDTSQLPVIAELDVDPTVSEQGLVASGCWVTLNYCTDPNSGSVSCSTNGGCTVTRMISACASLADSYCGNWR